MRLLFKFFGKFSGLTKISGKFSKIKNNEFGRLFLKTLGTLRELMFDQFGKDK
jgi:hypothetical protein